MRRIRIIDKKSVISVRLTVGHEDNILLLVGIRIALGGLENVVALHQTVIVVGARGVVIL